MKIEGNDPYFETGKTDTASKIGYYYSLSATGNTIPITGDGTSEYDPNYNKISISSPVQLLLTGTIDWNNVNLYFKVPKFDDSGSVILFTGGSDPIINWQLSSDIETLNSSGTQVMNNDICNSSGCTIGISLYNTLGSTLAGTGKYFQDFYTDEKCSSSGCTLKLSIVNELLTSDNKKIPYLEYKIELPTGTNIANYYSIIRSSGKSTGYRKDLKLYIPQQTTIEAFDFTVFQ
ncbi:hypothetical protein EOM39_07460, partial [Candidatus Gracilibacteria bacterium]|nr:hypothetical protein [Candidatus Gracilibacteria bacterium]